MSKVAVLAAETIYGHGRMIKTPISDEPSL